MRKYLSVLIPLLLAGCATTSQPAQKPESTSNLHGETVEPSGISPSVFVFAGKTQQITVFHQVMEFTNECPKIRLESKDGTFLDSLKLCEIKIPDYIVFDARKDFAYINFTKYQMRDKALIYELDLSLLKGGSMTALCTVAISHGALINQGCEQQGQ